MNQTITRRASLCAGLAMVIVPVILILAGVMIPGISVEFELYGILFDYNFSFFIYAGTIFAGLAIASLYFRSVRVIPRMPTKLSGPNTMVSIPWSRFIAGAMLVVVGVLSFSFFGAGFTDVNLVGLWLYLGGPSSAFPSGFIPLVIGAVLVSYAAFSVKGISIMHADGVVSIVESRAFNEIKTSIPLADIKTATLTNTSTGPRLLWIPLFTFQIYLLYIDGFSFLVSPFTFGTGLLIGGIYVLSASVQLAAIFLLVLFGGNHVMNIFTAETMYELHFYSPLGRHERRGIIEGFPGLAPVLGAPVAKASPERDSEFQQPGDIKRLILGLSLIAIAITSRIFSFYTSDPVRVTFIVFGGIVLVEWFKKELSARASSNSRCKVSVNGNQLHFLSARGIFHDEYFFKDATVHDACKGEGGMMKPAMLPRQNNAWDHIVATGLAVLIGFGISSASLLGPASDPFTAGTIAIHLVIGTGLLLLVLHLLFDPRQIIEVKDAVAIYQMISAEPQAKVPGRFARRHPDLHQFRKLFISRIVEIVIALSIGIAAGIMVFLV
nr:hypothetical protein [Candidatus Sigynarchaeota archaeon]